MLLTVTVDGLIGVTAAVARTTQAFSPGVWENVGGLLNPVISSSDAPGLPGRDGRLIPTGLPNPGMSGLESDPVG